MGPAVNPEFDGALIVSEETKSGGESINEYRKK